MQRSLKIAVLAAVCVCVVLYGFSLKENFVRKATAAKSRPLAVSAQANPSPDANLALNDPDQFNWMIFAQICQAAPTQNTVPGNRKTNNALWETWADDPYTYPSSPDPNNPPTWAGRNASGKALKLGITKQLARRGQLARVRSPRPMSRLPQVEAGGTEEVRRNQDSFQYIIDNGLWYTQGLAAAFAKGTPISFPPAAIEVKAGWTPISEAQKSSYHWNYDSNGNLYGLVALHIMTKTVPNWTWATFEWVGNKGRCDYMGCHDSFGVTPSDVAPNSKTGGTYPPGTLTPAVLSLFRSFNLGNEWQNYRLKGSQTDFTDATGRYTTLANSILEAGFVQYGSCMTCHANASFNAQGATQPSTGFITSGPLKGQSTFGAPNPAWFWSNTSAPPPPPTWSPPTYMQGDFVWGVVLASPAANTNSNNTNSNRRNVRRPAPRRRRN